MYVVKELSGLGRPPQPCPLGFYSGKEEGGTIAPGHRLDFYTKK